MTAKSFRNLPAINDLDPILYIFVLCFSVFAILLFTIRLQILTLYMFTIQDSKIPLRIFYLVLIKFFAKTNFHTEGTNYGVN